MRTYLSESSTSLQPNQVHVWSLQKSQHEARLLDYWCVLNHTERERALKYRFEKDRNNSIVARGALRKLLGEYLLIAPEKIEFEFEEYGKPALKGKSDMKFNVSHSGDTIVFAFVKKYNIGVDVEYTKREVEVRSVARHFFSEEEKMSLFALNEDYHNQAFYNCWTRKEAFIKAVGSGLSFPLDQFVVSVDCAKEATLLDTKWDARERKNWVLKSFQPAPDYIGAVSVRGRVCDIQFKQFQ